LSDLRLHATAPGLEPYVGDVFVDSHPRTLRDRPGTLVPWSAAGGAARVVVPQWRSAEQGEEGRAGSKWTAAAEEAYVNECAVGGGPQSFCECSLPYIKKAGRPSEIVESGSNGSLAARRKAVALIGEVLQRCSGAIGG
jgi:hypothetical protein